MEEIDDFANDKEIQRLRKEEAAFKKMMEESIGIVKRRFQTEKGSHKNLKKFWMIRSLRVPIITESFKSLNPLYPFHYSIIRYSSSVPMGRYRNSGTDHYFFGLIITKKNYRDTLIFPEKLSEKIADLFTRAETDFKEHKKFSRTFYVLSKDKEEIKKSFSNHTLDDLAGFKNMEMELLGNLCLFRSSRKPVSPNEAKNFCEIAAKLIHILA